MRRCTRKMLFRSIRDSLGRYLAILAIVALGVGFYSGLTSSEPAMRSTAADYMDDTGMYDYRFLSTLGFSDENVNAVRADENVAAAEGAFFSEALTEMEEGVEPLLFMSLTREVSVPVLSAGRMPENAGECLGDKAFFSEEDIGKSISVCDENEEDTKDLFEVRKFVITGLAGSPRYISTDRGSTSLGAGKLKGFVVVLPEAFDGDIYHELLVDCGLSDSFTDGYQDTADRLKPQMEMLLNTVGFDRYGKLRAEADEELADARKELDDGWAEYEDGKAEAEQEIADGWEEIESARQDLKMGESRLNKSEKEIKDGLSKLKDSEKTLKENEALLNEKAAQLEPAEMQLEAAEAQVASERATFDAAKIAQLSPLESNKQQLSSELSTLEAQIKELEDENTDDSRAQLEVLYPKRDALKTSLDEVDAALSQAKAQFNAAEQQLIAAESELAAQRATLEAGKSELEKGRAELASGKATIKKTRQQLEDGLSQIDYGRYKIKNGYAELEDAEEELREAEAEAEEELADALAELEDGEKEYADAVREAEEELKLEVHCLGRDSNAGCTTFKNDITIVSAVAKAFPIFFVLIAALVCVTTMTRMVNEERTQIGTLKALGYPAGKTASKYLLYAGSAAFLGCVLGLAAGITVVPYVVWYAYTILYDYTPVGLYFDSSIAVLSFAVAVPGIVAVTAYACRREMKEKPAELIRPKAPATGKRILLERIRFLWKRFGFLTKVMLRNAFRRPARVLMMILGIGGCTALMIAGFGCEDSLAHVMDYQYGEIFLYDVTVYYDSETWTSAEEASVLWADRAENAAVIWQGDADLAAADGNSRRVRLRSAEETEYEGTIRFTDNGQPVAYPKPGEILLTAGIADILDLSVGDTVMVSGDDFPASELRVCAIAENYVEKYAYVVPESIGTPTPNTGLLTIGENAAAAAASIRAEDGISYVSCAEDEKAVMEQSMSSIGLIIIMVVVCSAALAFITVFNLTNINIMERIREIATVKVLGFRSKETAAYVLRENLLLSVIGALAGLPLGVLLHRFIMELIKVEYIRYDIRILPRSYALGFTATVVFVLLINLLMRKKLDAVNMAESLKSVE